ncbi:MAG: endolytic transglycosylase MltG [Maledivibacter sp.]|nr:endolytic transglycosylase MltG [Maledivibacter sp.]
MLEKLKDFFYDFSDTLLSLFIVLIMALVIVWKLSGAMSIPLLKNMDEPSQKIIAENPQDNSTNLVDSNNNDTSTSDNVSQEVSNNDTSSETPVDSNINVEVVDNEPKDTKNIEDIKDIKVEIPKGTIGAGIAKILKEQGLVETDSEFLNRVEELELSPKLRYGTFTIKSNSSIDEMISIITGVSINN